ncbi:MAG: peptidoglycan DD-metalloendopeptidase family protein [Acidobacteria bacterium]|nr:peptidoglycan DD-metalloendopeptidase family protein [Acidobacteriota bacterium]
MRRSLVPALAVTVSLLVAGPAAADLGSDLSEIQNQIEALESSIAAAEGARTDFVTTLLETAKRLEAVARELLAAEQRLADTESSIVAKEALLIDLVERMDVRQGLILQLRADAGRERQAAVARAVTVYMAAHADASVRFAGGNDPDSGVGIVYANRVQAVADQVITEYELHRFREEQEVGRLEAEEKEAEAQREALRIQQAEGEAIAAEVAARAAEVETQLAQQRALLAQMEREIAHFEGEIADLAREEDLVRALIAQEQSGEGEAPGFLLRPVPGGVSSGFGWRIHPIYGDSRLHTGWDMEASCGEPIVAGAAGRVFFAGWKGGYGNAVMIDHGGGLATLYAHQSATGVVYDQQVVTGQVIGWIGSTGSSTACHLHWEVRVNGIPTDPSPWV